LASLLDWFSLVFHVKKAFVFRIFWLEINQIQFLKKANLNLENVRQTRLCATFCDGFAMSYEFLKKTLLPPKTTSSQGRKRSSSGLPMVISDRVKTWFESQIVSLILLRPRLELLTLAVRLWTP
jgi:hypothetical protein